MKKTILSLFLCFVFLSGCSSNKNEVNDIATNYLKSSLSYDFTEAKKHTTGEALEAINLVESYLSYTELSATVKDVAIQETEASKTYAKVQAFITREISSEEITEIENRLILVELVNLNGTWYVYNSTVLKLNSN